MKALSFAWIALAAVACAATPAVPQGGSDAGDEKAYVIGKFGYDNVDFFSKSPDARAVVFDKVNFVHEIDAFSPTDKRLPLNEVFLAQVSPGTRTVLSPGGHLTSVQQVKAARAKGYKVCIGPLRNINEVVIAIQTAPDYILLDKSLDTAKMRAVIRAHGKPERNDREPIDLSVKGDYVLNYASTANRSDGTRLRILTYNILATSWNHKPQLAPRAPAVAEAIRHFKPDLIGLQEAEGRWYAALGKDIAPYRFVRQKDPKKQPNPSCALLYDAVRFRLVEHGILPFTDKWIRCLQWALLEDVKTQARFIFTNTHWDLTVPTRQANARMMSGYLKDLKAKYKAPIICTGDFNADTDSAEIKELLASANLTDAMLGAPVKENAGISSWYWPITSMTPYKGLKQIDHVLTSSELAPLSARLVLDRKLLEASDHLPLVVDLR